MKMKLLIFIFFPSLVFSQMKISGQVFEQQTGKPIPYTVVYTDTESTITMTDDNGDFSLEVNSSEPVYFRQLAYDFLVISSDSLVNNPTIYLNRHIIELKEIVVTSDYAQRLLETAFNKLNSQLQKKEAIPYLFHLESTTRTGGEREAYALIEASLSKINKKGKNDWIFNLVQLDKIKVINNDAFYIKKKPLSLEIFPQGSYFSNNLKNYSCEIQDSDDNQLTIKASPIHPDKDYYGYNLFLINKRDTILMEAMFQSFPDISKLTTRKFRGIDWQKLTHIAIHQVGKWL
jgi:hypothetical protein